MEKTMKKLSENILDKLSLDFLRNQVLKNAYGNDDTVIAKLDPRVLIAWYLFFGLVPWFSSDVIFLAGCFMLVVVTTMLARVAGLVLFLFILGVFSQTGYLFIEKLMDLFEEYPVIVGAAHPYREGGHIPELPLEQLKRLHFLDLNGKDLALAREEFEEKTGVLAKKLEIPMISGSDTHQAVQYGCVRTKLNNAVNTIEKLYEQMKAGNYEIVVSSNASFQVKTAGLLKKALKEIHVLGGDYVSVLTSQLNV